ncbi:hypothetical protein V6L77_23825 [Pannonibacter sp. Pt2-lr]|uniref:Uncharacterized protein n=1 Tax=Pannonibacter anstelovis TaxID=3121537 RepID=A0ABU7ZHU4_9HYPH
MGADDAGRDPLIQAFTYSRQHVALLPETGAYKTGQYIRGRRAGDSFGEVGMDTAPQNQPHDRYVDGE